MRDTPPRGVLSCYFTTEVSPTTLNPSFPPFSTQLPPSSIHLYFIYTYSSIDDTLAIMIITLRHLLTILSHLFVSLLPYINTLSRLHKCNNNGIIGGLASGDHSSHPLLQQPLHYWCHFNCFKVMVLYTSGTCCSPSSILHPPPSTLHPYHPLSSSILLHYSIRIDELQCRMTQYGNKYTATSLLH